MMHSKSTSAIDHLTIAPLVVLAVAFGLFPGLLLDLWQGPVTDILGSVAPASLVGLP